MSVKIGKIKIEQAQRRGWLVGQFYPSDSPFNDSNVEIYLKKIPPGDCVDKFHFHPHGKEYIFVIKGKAVYRIDGEEVTIQSGDYLSINANTPDKLVKVIRPLTIFGVRHPSVPDNKVFLEN